MSRQPDDEQQKKAGSGGSARRDEQVSSEMRRKVNLLSLYATEEQERPTIGTLLIPFLFAAMEACWIDAVFLGLATLGLFQNHNPLMPLWTPFLVIAGSQWLYSHLFLRAARKAGDGGAAEDIPDFSIAPWFAPLLTVVILLSIWFSIYEPTAFVLDPRWLLALLNDMLLLNVHAYQSLVIIVLCVYFCWRGIRLSGREYEPSQIFGTMRIGAGVILAVILVRAASASAGTVLNNEVTLLLLIPIFLYLGLSAHALARINFVRHSHVLDTETNVDAQERAVLFIIGTLGLVLLVAAWIADTIGDPALLSQTQQLFQWVGVVYGWLIAAFGVLAVIVTAPLFWLLSWWESLFPPKLPPAQSGQGGYRGPKNPSHIQPIPPFLLPIIEVLLPLALVAVAIFLLRLVLRKRRRVRIRVSRRVEEIHESVWSWQLFLAQLRALLLAFWQRFFPPRTVAPEEQAIADERDASPAVRTIREMYRAMLKRASLRGYTRLRVETPYEYQQRLDGRTPLASQHIAPITDAYTAIRYGDMVPDEAEVARVRGEWQALEREWQDVK